MTDELRIPISTPGAAAAKKNLAAIAAGERDVGRAAETSGGQAKRGMGGLGRMFGSAASALKGLVAGFAGLQGARMVLASLREEHEREVRVTREHADALRAVLALTSLQGARAETVRDIYGMAGMSRRPVTEVAPSYYTLMGGTEGMSPERQKGLMNQALLMSRTDVKAPLEPLVNIFSTMGTLQGDLGPRQIGNLLSRTIESAKSTPGEMSAYLPDILSAAQSAEIQDVSVPLAMFTYGTRGGGKVATSGTAVKAMIMGLMNPTPEMKGSLARLGMPETGGVMGRLQWLSGQKNLPADVVAGLGGREGIAAVTRIAGAGAEFESEISSLRTARDAPGSLLAGRLSSLYKESPTQRSVDQAKQAEILSEGLDVKPERAAEEAYLATLELVQKESGVYGPLRSLNMGLARAQTWLGIEGLPTASEQMIRTLLAEGYEPKDIAALTGGSSQGDFESGFKGISGILGSDAQELTGEMRGVLRDRGAVPMFQGGTHYHNEDRHEPAGRRTEPAAPR